MSLKLTFALLLFSFRIGLAQYADSSSASKCRIKRIEFSDSSFFNFKYDEKGRLAEYRYDSDSERRHYTYQYFYNNRGRISHISLTHNDTLRYVCSYVYENNVFTRRRVAFFERQIVRDEIFHYNDKQQIDRIDFKQSDGDSILMRFEYNDAGYPIRRVRLANDYVQNTFAEIEWDTTVRAINPFENLFQGYPISNFFDREIGPWAHYPNHHPVSRYVQRSRDALGQHLHTNIWLFSNFVVNEQGFIKEMKLTHHFDDKVETFLQKCTYENCL
jgi:hypothetical protein